MSTDPLLQHPLRRLLNTSWPLFTAFRVEVRISWTITIWPVLFTLSFATATGWGMPIGEALLWGAAWTVGLFACVWTHEMGHIWMGRRCGIDSERMTLRGLGGLAHLNAPAQNPENEIKISLAGPATHLAWVAVLYPAKWLLEDAYGGETWWWMLHGFAVLQISFMIFNLLPIYPLDGGSVLRGALATRMHANLATLRTATIGLVGNGLFILTGLLGWTGLFDPFGYGSHSFLMVWLGIWGIQACRRLRLIARHEEVYGPSDPFQKTLLESAAAVRRMEEDDAKERQHREKAGAARRELQATVDRLLDRITEVGGVDNLTPRERKELERASKKLSEGS